MALSSFHSSIDLANLSDEHQAAFVLYLGYLLPKKLTEQNRVMTDKLFGSTRRAVERWMSMERFPRENVWEQFCQSEGAALFTAAELSNLTRLYRKEAPQIDRALQPILIDPYHQVVDVFYGRLKERWLLQEMLRNPDCRTIGIVGRAGMGKTTLMRRLLRDITQGQWQSVLEIVSIDAVCVEPVNPTVGVAWVDTVLDVLMGMYLATTGTALSLERRPTPQNKLDVLWDAIGDQKGLYVLVLDNAERLFDGDRLESSAQIFFEKLKDAPINLRIVTLSRRDLTPHLPIRHESIVMDDGLSPADAVAFLRKRDLNNAARLRNASDLELQRLAERVGYVPKALEAVVTHFLEDKFATIDDFLRRFPGSDPMTELLLDVYGHLQDETLRTLQIVATLNERATLDAVAHVGQSNPQNTRISCSQLIDLQVVEDFERVSGRIQLHALDQEYAYSLLQEGTRQQLHQRASGYFQTKAGNAMTARDLNDLGDHLTAFSHLMQAKAYNAAGQWYLYGYADRLRQLERNTTMMHIGEILTEQMDNPALRAGTAFFHSISLFLSGRREECLERLTTADRYARESENVYWLVRILSNTALIRSYMGQAEAASACIEAAEQNISSYQGEDSAWLEAQMLMRQMVVRLHQGKPESAIESARRLITLTDDPEAVATAQGNIGTVLFNTGKYQEALEAYMLLLEISGQHHFRVHHTITVSNIGSVMMEMGKPDEALAYYHQALHAATEEMRDKRLQSQILNNLIEVYGILGRMQDAEDSFNNAFDLAERIGLSIAQSTALSEWGWALLQQRRYEKAESKLQEGYQLGEQHRHPQLARFGAYLACAFLLNGKDSEALQQLQLLEPGNNKEHQTFTLLLRSVAHLKLKNYDVAHTLTQQTLDRASECIRDLPQAYRPYSIYALGQATQSILSGITTRQTYVVGAVREAFANAWAIADGFGIRHQAMLLLELLKPVAEETHYMVLQQALQEMPPDHPSQG